MYKILKILHLLGLVLFLGSVFGHIVAGSLGGAIGSAEFLFARRTISEATWVLTLPGLALSLLSGLGLVFLSPARRPWMAAHAGVALAIALVAAIWIVPAGHEALNGASASAETVIGGKPADIRAALMRENIAGAVNILLTLAIVALGVVKPTGTWRVRRAESAAARVARP